MTDRWIAVSAPALVFWLGGLAAWIYHRGGIEEFNRQTVWFDDQTAVSQIAVFAIAFLTVIVSGIIVDQLVAPALRLLEGYWPSYARPLRRRFTTFLADRAEADAVRWQSAYARIQTPPAPTADDIDSFQRLEHRRRGRPTAAHYFLPTPIGNILRAAERRPIDKYGLDTVVLWPRLWPALPDTTRADLLAARSSLDKAVGAVLWGLLACGYAPLTLWAIPVGLTTVAVSVVTVVPVRARVFGDLIEAAYDQHRTLLYRQVRWPLPTNPHEEPAIGRQLTAYLWRGSDDASPTFTPPF